MTYKFVKYEGETWHYHEGPAVMKCKSDGTQQKVMFGVFPVTDCESHQKGIIIRVDS